MSLGLSLEQSKLVAMEMGFIITTNPVKVDAAKAKAKKTKEPLNLK